MKTLKEIREFVVNIFDTKVIIEYNNKHIHDFLLTSKIDIDKILIDYASIAMISDLLIDDPIGLIVLKRKSFAKRSEEQKKALILHELGHIYLYINYKGYMNNTDKELLAQRWAIDKADKIKDKKTKKVLEDQIRYDWGNFKWNENGGAYRRYIQAHKLWMKGKLNL